MTIIVINIPCEYCNDDDKDYNDNRRHKHTMQILCDETDKDHADDCHTHHVNYSDDDEDDNDDHCHKTYHVNTAPW